MGAKACAKVLHSPGHPISLLEFSEALSSTWNPRYRSNARTFGLAISGGVDSMALAALCSKLLHDKARIVTPFPPSFGFQAFVVDHGVRDGSCAEANAVSKLLESRGWLTDIQARVKKLIGEGIPTRILKIAWVLNDRPAELTNFESLARKHRFQILGKACRDLGINSLFLAHHEDDQAETVMMRLIHGHRILGLTGMKTESDIPECRGLYGVHESGEELDARPPSFTLVDSLPRSPPDVPDTWSSRANLIGPLAIERGGIKVYRPLLGFSKARLIATCQAENMTWFEDSTNQDPGVTMRNAVRHIFRFHKLPAALSRGSMLNTSKKAQSKMRTLKAIADDLLQKSSISNFETRAGTLTIQFASLNNDQIPLQSWEDRGLIAALLLRQVILVVTPEGHVPISSLHSAVLHLFPEISRLDRRTTRPIGFTVSGLQFLPLDSAGSGDYVPSPEKCEWLISRQPYPASAKLPALCIPSPCTSWSTWELYDGRFWFRIQNLKAEPIFVRPFRKHDLKSFKISLPTYSSKKLQHLLKRLTPGNVRWTLPALVLKEADGNEMVLALPTLGISVPNLKTRVKWEVRFKKVDIDRLPVTTKS